MEHTTEDGLTFFWGRDDVTVAVATMAVLIVVTATFFFFFFLTILAGIRVLLVLLSC